MGYLFYQGKKKAAVKNKHSGILKIRNIIPETQN